MVRISELDVHDDSALGEFWDVEQAAQRADRKYPLLRSLRQLEQQVHRPGPYYERTLLTAYDEERLVGVAELGLPRRANLHLAELEIDVLPQSRRRGIGRALHDEALRRARADGRTTFAGEAHQSGDRPSPSAAFAAAMGFEVANREDHQVLGLPVPAALFQGLPDSAPAYDVVIWRDRAPDDLIEAYARMRTQMGADAPQGDLDREPLAIDVKKIRLDEERTAEAFRHVVAAARRASDGEFGGYTLVFLPHDSDDVLQDDTLVMPVHRGHRLGITLKAAVLRLLAEVYPERRQVHTWNGVGNAPMQAINQTLGFRPVEVLLEMQRKEPRV
jgi:GNAT superfamily N-acetyltransferase